jgi:hypothetical protein
MGNFYLSGGNQEVDVTQGVSSTTETITVTGKGLFKVAVRSYSNFGASDTVLVRAGSNIYLNIITGPSQEINEEIYSDEGLSLEITRTAGTIAYSIGKVVGV